MILSKLKTYLIVAAGAVGGALVIALNILLRRNEELRDENRQATATRDHALDVLEKDTDINEQEDARLADALRELNDEGHSSELEDPNDWYWTDEK